MGLESLAGAATSMTPWGAIAQGVGGLIKGGIGIFQNAKANKMLKKLQYPTMSVPSAIRENKVQAELDANVGLPSEQYNNAMKNIQRNQVNSLAYGANSRMGLGLVSALNDNANNATAELDAADAAARMSNKAALRGVNSELGNWQHQVWKNNVKDKYDRDYEYAMNLKGAGRQNTMSGVDSLAAAGLSFGQSGGFKGNNAHTQVGNVPSSHYPSTKMTTLTPAQTFRPGNFPSTPNNIRSPYPYNRPNINYNSWGFGNVNGIPQDSTTNW